MLGLSKFYYNKLHYNGFVASNFKADVQPQIEDKQKMQGRSVTFGLKSVEKRPLTEHFFEDE